MANRKEIWEEVKKEIKVQRNRRFNASPQLALGELISKLETVDKNLPVYFDDENYIPDVPAGIDTWRGSYDELAIGYEKTSKFIKIPKVKDLLSALDSVIGSELPGWKGGSYLMSKNTPVWVATQGKRFGFSSSEKERYFQAVVDIIVKDNKAIIKTELVKF